MPTVTDDLDQLYQRAFRLIETDPSAALGAATKLAARLPGSD